MKLTRRQVLTAGMLAAATGASAQAGRRLSALSAAVLGPASGHDTLVVVFLRGGADGLSIVVPWAEDAYHRLRPSIGLTGPRDAGAARAQRVLDLDGFFGLHPALAPLLPLYRDGRLAAVHAVGSQDRTRSHFEAMATIERGLATSAGTAGGWLARHLAATAGDGGSALRAVALADTMPESLRGATAATALTSVGDYRLGASAGRSGPVARTLAALYADPASGQTDALRRAGRETLAALDAVRALAAAPYRPANGAAYPKSEAGNGLQQAACLTKGGVGLEVACLDVNGWDTHVAQGRDTGWLPSRLSDLARSLAALAADLGLALMRVTVVVLTEFGRRAYENSGEGTDHGRAGCMLLLGGGVAGGKVHAAWPGLGDSQLEPPGDLRVTTDYRDVLAEVLAHRCGNRRVEAVFPGWMPRAVGVVRAGPA